MRGYVKRSAMWPALAALLVPLAAAQRPGAPPLPGQRGRPGTPVARGAAFDGLALRGKEFHVVSLVLVGPRERRTSGAGRGTVGFLLFGTGRYGAILEEPAPGRTVKGTIVALEQPVRPKREGARAPAGIGERLAQVIEKGRKVGTLELQVKPYEGRIVAVGKAGFAEGAYKGSWKLILFTRPRAPWRPGPFRPRRAG